jgi:WD40 repeat protein
LVDFVSEDVLVTVGLDKTVKLWKLSDDVHELIGKTGVSLISSHKHKEDIVSVKYSHKNQMLLFMDKECSLGVISLNLNSLKKKEASDNDSLDVEMVDLNDLDLDDVKDAIDDVKE